MTDNEKAATFIGWRAGVPCAPHECLHDFLHERPLEALVPDMTDPRNYMKALLGLGAYEVIFQAFDGLQVCIYKQDYRSNLRNKPDGYGFDEEDWGLAAIDALVGIYDAEHKETA